MIKWAGSSQQPQVRYLGKGLVDFTGSETQVWDIVESLIHFLLFNEFSRDYVLWTNLEFRYEKYLVL